jgi:hypothetical protein
VGVGGQLGTPCNTAVVHGATVLHQWGDGTCLYHALAWSLGKRKLPGRQNGFALRHEIAVWIGENPNKELNDYTIADWVQFAAPNYDKDDSSYDNAETVKEYVERMKTSGHGGGLEIAVCSLLYNVNVHVFNRVRGGHERITCYDVEDGKRTLNLLYVSKIHFDVLVLKGVDINAPVPELFSSDDVGE